HKNGGCSVSRRGAVTHEGGDRLGKPHARLALRSPRPVTSGRSSADSKPGRAPHTTGIAFTIRVAVSSTPPTAWSPFSSANSNSHRIDGVPLISTRYLPLPCAHS